MSLNNQAGSRSVSNLAKNSEKENDLGINTELYKPSTAKKETHVSDDLKGGQSKETFDAPPKSTPVLTSGGKVWLVASYFFSPLSSSF